MRGRLIAGYWWFTAVVLFAVVSLAHFVGAEREAPIGDIYVNPAWGFLALLDLVAMYAGLAVLAGVAIVVLRRGEGGPI